MEGDRLLLPPLPSSKHRCKVCRKSFPSGRSLGGHMTSHVNMAANSSSDGDERQQSSYSLREKPKKTWRLSDSGDGDGEMQCRECGKEFLSWRGLFGHMRCHSEKPSEEGGEHDGFCGNAEHRNGFECQSDSEAAAATVSRRRRRSKWIGRASACSLSASKYKSEDEDGAISLMLLSRDVRHWSGSCGESSDKNSEVLESWDFVSNGSEKKGSDLGDSRNGFTKVESDSSDDEIVRVDTDEFKKPKVYASSTDDFENPHPNDESRPGCSKEEDVSAGVTELSRKPRFDGSGLELRKNSLSTLEKFEAYDAKLGTDLVNDSLRDASDGCSGKATKKRSRFECKACNKIFHSYQALGGHRASHKRMKGCPGHRIHGAENSIETDASVVETATDVSIETGCGSPKVNKGHQCLICSKFFSSGQALGGHKRSHLVANTGSCPVVIAQKPFEMPDLLDLNLPAPISGDPNRIDKGSDDFKSWWLRGNLKHEPLIGVISN